MAQSPAFPMYASPTGTSHTMRLGLYVLAWPSALASVLACGFGLGVGFHLTALTAEYGCGRAAFLLRRHGSALLPLAVFGHLFARRTVRQSDLQREFVHTVPLGLVLGVRRSDGVKNALTFHGECSRFRCVCHRSIKPQRLGFSQAQSKIGVV